MRIHLKIINKAGRVVRNVVTTKKNRIWSILSLNDCKNFHFWVKVVYCYRPYYYNEGEYKKKEDLIFALRAFTEKDLVEEYAN